MRTEIDTMMMHWKCEEADKTDHAKINNLDMKAFGGKRSAAAVCATAHSLSDLSAAHVFTRGRIHLNDFTRL